MAEIPIQHKAGSKGWMWALLAVVMLGAFAWWLLGTRDGDQEVAAGEIASPVGAGAPEVTPNATGDAPVTSFLTWADETSARAAAPDHDYVAAGITRLAGAIGALASRDSLGGSPVAQQVHALNRLAEQVQQDSDALGHADIVHAAFESSAALLGDIQQRHYPAAAGAVADLRDASRAIAKDRPLLDQKAEIDRFFSQAATAVRAMSTGV